MAFAGGTNEKLLINGYDLTAYFNNTQMGGVAGAYDTSVYGVGSKQYIPGLKDDKWTLAGFFDGVAAAIDEVLAAALGVADAIATAFPHGDAVGSAGRGINGHLTAHGSTSPVDGVVSTQAEIQSKVGPERIISLGTLAAIGSGTVDGTAVDNAAATTNGGVGYLQVTAEAATTATIKVQHSTDNSTWVDLITFTAVTAAPAKERIAVTGTVRRYLRFESAATGGTVTAQVAFGRK